MIKGKSKASKGIWKIVDENGNTKEAGPSLYWLEEALRHCPATYKIVKVKGEK